MEIRIGEDIILIGTAHISEKSVDEVREAIGKYKPDVVGIELDENRYKVLLDKAKAWKDLPLRKLIEGRNAYFFMAQAFLSNMQKRLGKSTGVEPGSEMLAAAEEAKKNKAEISFVDRDITITLKRAWRKMRFTERVKIFWELIWLMVPPEEEELDIDIEEMMKEDAISMMMKELKGFAPTVAEVLIDERDEYISKRILEETKKGKVLAVVGAGHLEGIKRHIESVRKGSDELSGYEELEEIPKRGFSWSFAITGAMIGIMVGSFIGRLIYPWYLEGLEWGLVHMWWLPFYGFDVWVRMAIASVGLFGLLIGLVGGGAGGMKGLGYSVPFLFVFLLVFLVLNNQWEDARDVLVAWIIINGVCALIGAIVAWGHPASWLTAFLAAPWTSLNPAVAAGWVAGAVELYFRKPKNEDLLELFSGTFETLRQFLRNKVFKVLAVTAMVNLGSVVGSFIAWWWIGKEICI